MVESINYSVGPMSSDEYEVAMELLHIFEGLGCRGSFRLPREYLVRFVESVTGYDNYHAWRLLQKMREYGLIEIKGDLVWVKH